MRRQRSANNDAARTNAQTLKEINATEKDVGSEDAQVVDHDESKPPPNATGRQRESLSAAAVVRGTLQVIYEEDLTANTISIADITDSCEEALRYQAGDSEKHFKNSMSLVKARDDVFSVVKTQSMLSFRSGCVPNATSTDV
jgi:hypothetical protein